MIRWGVLGFGRAGRARARAIVDCERSVLAAGMRGDMSAFDVTAHDHLAPLLAGVDAVAVCTPGSAHPGLVRSALLAGCHVVCEYPLAGSRAEAQGLFDLSEAQGVVLHVEHIELLAASQQGLREAVSGAAVIGGTIAEVARPGGRALDSLARVHRVVDALGPPDRVSTGVLHYGAAQVRLDLASDRQALVLQTSRGEVCLANRQISIDGVPLCVAQAPGLFARDHACAVARILDGGVPYVADERVIAVLGLIDGLGGDR